MKIYLAHNYVAREWLAREIIPKVVAAGHEITSRWIYDVKDNPMMDAQLDLNGIMESDVFVLFTDQVGSTPGRGKYIEYGYAMCAGLPTVLVGSETELSCVFFALADYNADTIGKALGYIANLEKIGEEEEIEEV